MIPFVRWIGRRLKCAVVGHRLESDRIYYGPACSVMPGYRCDRCGRTQLVAYRWQEVSEG